jgi:3-hydroxyisobutyrate dehydrogenase
MKKILPEMPVIGWIGTGVMGASMPGHMIDRGYKAFVHTRTKEKARGLIEKGAVWSSSVADLARG